MVNFSPLVRVLFLNVLSMNKIEDQRSDSRILAVCKVFNSKGCFLGFTLDLTTNGIQIIVNKDFSQELEFEIILNQEKEDDIIDCLIKIKVQQMWRSSTNEEFDQIGGKIIEVDNPQKLKKLIDYYEQKAKDKLVFQQ